MDPVALKKRAIDAVDARAAVLDDLASRIHERPELAFEERYACGALADALAGEGVTVERGVGGLETAFVANTGASSPLVVVLGEYDALPGVGHACGHNLMGTAAIGAFLALRDLGRDLPGRVRVVGCPAEERGNGKNFLIRAKVFDGAAAALMYHPGDRDEIDPLMLAMASLEVEFLGKAAHAAAEPHEGKNALDALLLSWTALSAMRLVIRSDSRFHGVITDGGKAANIIPDRAAARFMVRSPDNTYLRELQRRVIACFEGAAKQTGCELKYAWSETCDLVTTNKPLADAFTRNAQALGRKMNARRPGDTHGSTDMGNVTSVVPGIHPFLSITDGPVPGHSIEFAAAAATAKAFETMRVAAKALAMTAVDVLTDPALAIRAREAFDVQRH